MPPLILSDDTLTSSCMPLFQLRCTFVRVCEVEERLHQQNMHGCDHNGFQKGEKKNIHASHKTKEHEKNILRPFISVFTTYKSRSHMGTGTRLQIVTSALSL